MFGFFTVFDTFKIFLPFLNKNVIDKRKKTWVTRKYFLSNTFCNLPYFLKKEIKCNEMIKKYGKMINYDFITKENIEEHNSNWPKIKNYTYRILLLQGMDQKKQMYYLI